MVVQGLFALLLCVAVCTATKVVTTLDYDNYYSFWKNNEVTLINFCKPSGEDCKDVAPLWDRLAEKFAGRAVIATCDPTEDLELLDEFPEIQYAAQEPHQVLLKRGKKKAAIYTGDIDEDDFIKYIEAWLAPFPKVLGMEPEVSSYAQSKSLIGFFKKFKGKEYDKVLEYATLNRGMREVAFVDLKKTQLSAEYAVAFEESPSLLSIPEARPISEAFVLNNDALKKLSMKDLRAWVEDTDLPVVYELKEQASARGKPVMEVFIGKAQEKEPVIKAAATQVALKYRSRLTVAYHSGDEEKEGKEEDEEDLELAEGYSGAIIRDQREAYEFPGGRDLNISSLKNFAKRFFKGKLQPKMRSQSKEEAKTERGLTTIIGYTFPSLIMNNTEQDILLEMSAPWCTHCKELAPDYQKLATHLEDVPTVMVAVMDGESNTYDEKRFPIQGYPTIFFIPAGKETLVYKATDAAPDAKGLLQFIVDNAVHPLPDALHTLPQPEPEPKPKPKPEPEEKATEEVAGRDEL